ncbi:MAG: hypothetical protein ACKVT0_14465 [Planctomycetaceae bacterium]
MSKQKDLTVNDLERLLAKKKTSLVKLERERDRLAAKLHGIQRQIEKLNGSKNVSLALPAARRGLRTRNSKSLHTHVIELVTENKKGLTLGELHEKILGRGYKSTSTNFKNVLYQCLYHSPKIILNQETHRYGLKEIKPKETK